jgi:hypothetical protein
MIQTNVARNRAEDVVFLAIEIKNDVGLQRTSISKKKKLVRGKTGSQDKKKRKVFIFFLVRTYDFMNTLLLNRRAGTRCRMA